MTWHHLDANMIAADAYYSSAILPHDFDVCEDCDREFDDADDDMHDPRHVQSPRCPSLCVSCFAAREDE